MYDKFEMLLRSHGVTASDVAKSAGGGTLQVVIRK